MNQENRINFASAQQSNDTMLTISGVVLGFSIAFLSRAGTLGYSLLLKEAWAVFAIAILLNVSRGSSRLSPVIPTEWPSYAGVSWPRCPPAPSYPA